MRARLLSPFLLLLVAAPLQGQSCHPEPAPDIASLFPDQVAELGRQFYTRQGECTTNLYRPVVMSSDEGGAWAVVSIEPNPESDLGSTAHDLSAYYAQSSTRTHSVDGWPAARQLTKLGDEFIALRGAFKVTVLVKDGDEADSSAALASTILREIFLRIPCSTDH